MKRLLLSFFLSTCFFIIAGFVTTNTTYASTAICRATGGSCIANGVCRAEPGYTTDTNSLYRCDSSTQVCCVSSNIATRCNHAGGTWRQTSNGCPAGEEEVPNFPLPYSGGWPSYPTAYCCKPLPGCPGSKGCTCQPGRGCGSGLACVSLVDCSDMGSVGEIVYCDTPIVGAVSNYSGSPYTSRRYYASNAVRLNYSIDPNLSYGGYINSVQQNWFSGVCANAPPPPTYTLSGYVRDNSTGVGVAGVTVRRSTSSTPDTTDGNGFYSFGGLGGSTSHAISITVPTNYVAGNPNPPSQNVSMNNTNRSNINFTVVPVYSISGSVFIDSNKNHLKDAGEGINPNNGRPPLNINFSANGGNMSFNTSNGTFTVSNLFAGTYRVSYTAPFPDSSYEYYHPPSSNTFSTVIVGPGCRYEVLHPVAAARATCNARGDISNLNFHVTNSHKWIQGVGLNMWFGSTFVNRIPAAPVYPAYTSIIDNLP